MGFQQNTPFELYFWPTPNGWKISVFLEEAGLPYRTHFVNIGAGDQFKPDFLRISPNNRMPALVDREGPDGAPVSIFESGAILQYLGRKFRFLYPSGERARVMVDQWLMWQMGGFGPMLGQNHHFRLYAPEKLPYAIERYINETRRLYGVLDRQIGDKDTITGDYSIADIACLGWAMGAERQGMDLEADFPGVARWRARLTSRPAVRRGLELGRDIRERIEREAREKQAQEKNAGAE